MIALSPGLSALPALIAAVVASLSLVLLMSPGRLPTAHPNLRSLHQRPVPRGGGLAVWSGWLVGTIWLAAPKPWLAPLLLIVLVSFWDDRYGVPAWTRDAPLVYANGRLLYVPGLGIDARVRAAPGDAQVVLRWIAQGGADRRA